MQTSLTLVERRTLDPFTLFCVIFICVLSCLYFNLMCVYLSSKVNFSVRWGFKSSYLCVVTVHCPCLHCVWREKNLCLLIWRISLCNIVSTSRLLWYAINLPFVFLSNWRGAWCLVFCYWHLIISEVAMSLWQYHTFFCLISKEWQYYTCHWINILWQLGMLLRAVCYSYCNIHE